MTAPTHATSVRALAAALALGKSRVGDLSNEPWWPAKGPQGWEVAACVAAYQQHVRGRAGADAPIAAGPPPAEQAAAPRERKPLDARGLGLVEQLRTSDDTLALLSASVQLLSQRLGDGAIDGGVPARVAGDLKNLAQELRVAQEAAFRRAQVMGELISRDAAKACMGALARRFVLALERLESRVASQVELWLTDGAFAAGTVDDRAIAVRAWVRAQTRQARVGESDQEARAAFEAAIATEVAEGRAG